jgi:hypothetical protein
MEREDETNVGRLRDRQHMSIHGEITKEEVRKAIVTFKILGQKHTQKFRILSKTGSDNMVLGIPWLREYNPDINWKTGEIVSAEGPLDHGQHPKQRNRVDTRSDKEMVKEKDFTVEKSIPGNDSIEKELEEVRLKLPEQLQEFADVFWKKDTGFQSTVRLTLQYDNWRLTMPSSDKRNAILDCFRSTSKQSLK